MDKITLRRNRIEGFTILIGWVAYLIKYASFTITQIQHRPQEELTLKEYIFVNFDVIFECSIYALVIFTVLSLMQPERIRLSQNISYIISNFMMFVSLTISLIFLSSFCYLYVPY